MVVDSEAAALQAARFCESKTEIKVVEIAGFGGPERLVPAARPMPNPKRGEVLIEIAAAGVNRPDVIQREGNYPPPPGVTDVPGLEVAGTVIRLGAGTRGLSVGDRVVALVPGGGYATHCVADAGSVLPLPRGMEMIQAAAIPENWFTVWDHVVESCRLRAGETILIHGGGSGIGTAAIQLALSLGARVFTTAGTIEKVSKLEAMGCACTVNYREQDFVDVLLEETGGAGVDVIIDMVGGSYVARNIALAAQGGRISLIAALDGLFADDISIEHIMMKQLLITGNTLRNKPPAYKRAIARKLRAHAWPLFEAGTAGPIIDSVFPMDQADAAHRLMESSTHFGKIVLDVKGKPG